MKKLIVALLFLVMASPAFGAGTIVIAAGGDEYLGANGRRITYNVVFDASAAAFANIALDSIENSQGQTVASLKGWYLSHIDYVYGTTGVTDDTSLYVWSVEDKIDILGAEGFEKLDEASYDTIFPLTITRQLTGNEIMDIDDNAVNDATCTLIFHFYKSE